MEFIVYRKGREVAVFNVEVMQRRFVRSKTGFLVNRMLTIILNKEVVI